MKQTVCKVLKIFQYGKYLVAYVLNRTLGVTFILREETALVKSTWSTATHFFIMFMKHLFSHDVTII